MEYTPVLNHPYMTTETVEYQHIDVCWPYRFRGQDTGLRLFVSGRELLFLFDTQAIRNEVMTDILQIT